MYKRTVSQDLLPFGVSTIAPHPVQKKFAKSYPLVRTFMHTEKGGAAKVRKSPSSSTVGGCGGSMVARQAILSGPGFESGISHPVKSRGRKGNHLLRPKNERKKKKKKKQ